MEYMNSIQKMEKIFLFLKTINTKTKNQTKSRYIGFLNTVSFPRIQADQEKFNIALHRFRDKLNRA